MEKPTPAAAFDELTDILSQRLSQRRFLHVLGAVHTAIGLAERWQVDKTDALTAALLHDCAKELDQETLQNLIREHLDEMHPDDREHPSIWHALAGEIIAREEFGIDSPAIGTAIRLHPTGGPDMQKLDQIIFLSDYVEPLRKFPGVEEIRSLAASDLAAAVDAAVIHKTGHLATNGKSLHPRSRGALEAAEQRRAAKQPDTTKKGESTQR